MRQSSFECVSLFLRKFACVSAVKYLWILVLAWQSAWSADIPGSEDHALLSRFPGTSIVGYDRRAFDQIFVPSEPGSADGAWLAGRMTWIAYQAPSNISTLQLFRNYQQALQGAGFTTTFTCDKEACGKKFIRSTIGLTNRWVGQSERFMPNSARYLAARLPREPEWLPGPR